MQDGRINNSQISASSTYSSFTPQKARLRASSAWAAGQNKPNEYLQIDLITTHIISKVATQGRNGQHEQYVKQYRLKFTLDNLKWTNYIFSGRVMVCTPYYSANPPSKFVALKIPWKQQKVV